MSRSTPALSAVVPCFNEEEVLPELHRRLSAACRAAVGEDYELVLVNDGSSDRSWAAMSALAEADPRVVAVDLARNHGHQLALTAGLSLCRGARILIIDADLQDPPELLPAMMARMDEGYDVVYGQRVEREGETWFKKASAGVFYRLMSRVSDVAIPLDTGDFRLISRRVLDVLNAMPERHRFIRGMIAWIGFPQVPFPYRREPRLAGVTKYPLLRMIRFAVDALTGFSSAPLRLSLHLGHAGIAVAALLAAYVAYSWLFLDVVRGWASSLLPMLFFSSLQLWMLGIMGEYIGRLYAQSKQRPLFVIAQVRTAATAERPAVTA